jgi:hypothetical protein
MSGKEERKVMEKAKWSKFTYAGKETRVIMKIFKNTKVKVSFTTDNTIEKNSGNMAPMYHK